MTDLTLIKIHDKLEIDAPTGVLRVRVAGDEYGSFYRGLALSPSLSLLSRQTKDGRKGNFMPPSTIVLQDIRDYGLPTVLQQGDFQGAFVVRLRQPATGAITAPQLNGDYVIGFSAICTHMGCVLIQDSAATSSLVYQPPQDNTPEHLVCGPCPCHGTSFDLLKTGLVILGPATQNLAQLQLRINDDQLEAFAWFTDAKRAIDPRSERWPF